LRLGIILVLGLLVSPAWGQPIGPRCLYGQGPDCPPPNPQPPPPEPVEAFCWTETPVPNTNVLVITSLFPTNKSNQEIVERLQSIFADRGYATTVQCMLGGYYAQISAQGQVIKQLRQQGYQLRLTTDTVR
jgi:hypothetical protein